MAESIEYSSIVKFINEDIIQGKIAAQAGGSEAVESGGKKDVKTEFKNEVEDKAKLSGVWKMGLPSAVSTVTNYLSENIPGASRYPYAIGILAFGLTVAAAYYLSTEDSDDVKNDNFLYILAATIVAFVLAGPGTDVIDYVKTKIFGAPETGPERKESADIAYYRKRAELVDLRAQLADFIKIPYPSENDRKKIAELQAETEKLQAETEKLQAEIQAKKLATKKQESALKLQSLFRGSRERRKYESNLTEVNRQIQLLESKKTRTSDENKQLLDLNEQKKEIEAVVAGIRKEIEKIQTEINKVPYSTLTADSEAKEKRDAQMEELKKLQKALNDLIGEMAGGDLLGDITSFVKNNISTILATLGGAAVIAGFSMVDSSLSFSENVNRILGRGSSKNVSFYFNASNGKIEASGSTNKTVTLNKHFGIVMKISGNTITYTVNGTPLDSISYIEGKPVQTALVVAYMIKDRHSHMPSAVSAKSDSDYKYTIEDDGSVRLFDKEGKEIASVNMAIRQQLEGKEAEAKATRAAVCKALFNVGESDKTCSAHFYNILGKAGLGMLENMGQASAGKQNIEDALVNAKPHIQYEILKNLDWKMKVSNGNKEMVTVEQWLERLGQDARTEMKELVAGYKKYLEGKGSHVKVILNRMVANLNNNSRLLDEKYKEAVATPQPSMRRKRTRLSASQVANLRSQVLSDNVSLNAPFPVPGRPGVFLTNYTSPFAMNGGADDTYRSKFEQMKHSLAAFNQKLSSDTERKINSKIDELNQLDARLTDIHRKINEYTRVLRTEKYPSNIQRTVTLSDIENLINQYKSGTQEQTKQIVTLSTAFGKIKMLLEKADASAKPSTKNYLFDL